jgi:hypothetical protein
MGWDLDHHVDLVGHFAAVADAVQIHWLILTLRIRPPVPARWTQKGKGRLLHRPFQIVVHCER